MKAIRGKSDNARQMERPDSYARTFRYTLLLLHSLTGTLPAIPIDTCHYYLQSSQTNFITLGVTRHYTQKTCIRTPPHLLLEVPPFVSRFCRVFFSPDDFLPGPPSPYKNGRTPSRPANYEKSHSKHPYTATGKIRLSCSLSVPAKSAVGFGAVHSNTQAKVFIDIDKLSTTYLIDTVRSVMDIRKAYHCTFWIWDCKHPLP